MSRTLRRLQRAEPRLASTALAGSGPWFQTSMPATAGDEVKIASDGSVAAGAPKWVRPEHVPAEVYEHEREIARARAREEGKPENMLERIVEGRIEKFKDEVCLLRQLYVRDESITVEKLIMQNVAAIGENIIVRRFARWELGEGL